MLRCLKIRSHALQHIATHCNTLQRARQHGTTRESPISGVRGSSLTRRNTLQHIATRTATYCNKRETILRCSRIVTHIATHCTTPRHALEHIERERDHIEVLEDQVMRVATHCNTPQHALQHIATRERPY